MSSSNIGQQTKSNLAVASLINGGITKSTKASVQPQEYKHVETTTATTTTAHIKDVPTVANTDLLYKNVSSGTHIMTVSSLQPSTTITGNFTFQQYSGSLNNGDYRMVSTSSNPLTNIRTLTNAITTSPSLEDTLVSVTKVDQFQGKTPYVPILPASKIKPQSNNEATLKLISNELIKNTVLSCKGTSVPAKPSFHAKISSRKTNKKVSPGTGNAIFVPRGWNRIVEKQHITYVR